MANISDYITIKKAAELMGVTKNTLRNWEAQGKLSTCRHPINNYRMYKKEDLDRILEEMSSSYK